MNVTLERTLLKVQKPSRYTGGEYGQIIKDKSEVNVRMALCFPDTYEIGMSNLGMRILYGAINCMEGVWCERVFAPWSDMEEQMREQGIALFALESHDPVSDFDILGFSVSYEMAYSNIVNLLDLAGLPRRSAQRHELSGLVIAGGSCMYNPAPLADFIDAALLGEGEELNIEFLELYKKAKAAKWSKSEFLKEAAKIQGVYIPAYYEERYNEDGTLREIRDLGGAETVKKRIVHDLDKSYFPTETIVPSTEIVHDRTNLEMFRGCIRGCRFCQAGYVYRPVRAKSPEVLLRQAKEALEHSGYQEITLSSLSTSDYRQLEPLCDSLLDFCVPRNTNLSLPSLRADNFSVELMHKLQKVRKSGLTFAPEAGSQRLRDVINKNLTEKDLLDTLTTVFSGGWNSVKLYFMLGLPTETDEDVLAIAELAEKALQTWRQAAVSKNRGVNITISTACFVPKAHTPFQWVPQLSKEEFVRRQRLLSSAIRSKAIRYNWHDSDTSFLEAAFARGDRRLGRVIELAVDKGARLDGWSEHFSLERWRQAFDEAGIDPAFYAERPRGNDEIFPWDNISVGVDKDYLWREYGQALAGEVTPDCRLLCTGCGADSLLEGRICDE